MCSLTHFRWIGTSARSFHFKKGGGTIFYYSFLRWSMMMMMVWDISHTPTTEIIVNPFDYSFWFQKFVIEIWREIWISFGNFSNKFVLCFVHTRRWLSKEFFFWGGGIKRSTARPSLSSGGNKHNWHLLYLVWRGKRRRESLSGVPLGGGHRATRGHWPPPPLDSAPLSQQHSGRADTHTQVAAFFLTENQERRKKKKRCRQGRRIYNKHQQSCIYTFRGSFFIWFFIFWLDMAKEEESGKKCWKEVG